MKGWVSSDEIVNSQSLLDEISRINKENDELKQKLESAEKKISKPSKSKGDDADFEELIKILEVTEVKIPSSLTDGEEDTIKSLLSIFLGQKESFVTGVTNKAQTTEVMSFLYFNVAPKLQIHGLVLNEKVASVMWRRFSITQKGTALLAYIEKKRLLK
ncbi:hypothetical protein NG896_02925 [Aeromonas veronii]|uniref:hypothetical protein n=1 Tax=Aeromonas veronii TaxID=654 RepID=UPI002091BFBD|nr:hypothetical protein [Aeromonas veronii]MCO5341513.1 hypothetical protein [Aeromonas veronii]